MSLRIWERRKQEIKMEKDKMEAQAIMIANAVGKLFGGV